MQEQLFHLHICLDSFRWFFLLAMHLILHHLSHMHLLLTCSNNTKHKCNSNYLPRTSISIITSSLLIINNINSFVNSLLPISQMATIRICVNVHQASLWKNHASIKGKALGVYFRMISDFPMLPFSGIREL
jgi:hypothetical protein